MTATARAGFSDDDSTPYMTYHTFGVAAAEVEIDCCTGERQLLRADMMFDAGRSVNPAIDLGQVTLLCPGRVGSVCSLQRAAEQ